MTNWVIELKCQIRKDPGNVHLMKTCDWQVFSQQACIFTLTSTPRLSHLISKHKVMMKTLKAVSWFGFANQRVTSRWAQPSFITSVSANRNQGLWFLPPSLWYPGCWQSGIKWGKVVHFSYIICACVCSWVSADIISILANYARVSSLKESVEWWNCCPFVILRLCTLENQCLNLMMQADKDK